MTRNVLVIFPGGEKNTKNIKLDVNPSSRSRVATFGPMVCRTDLETYDVATFRFPLFCERANDGWPCARSPPHPVTSSHMIPPTPTNYSQHDHMSKNSTFTAVFIEAVIPYWVQITVNVDCTKNFDGVMESYGACVLSLL